MYPSASADACSRAFRRLKRRSHASGASPASQLVALYPRAIADCFSFSFSAAHVSLSLPSVLPAAAAAGKVGAGAGAGAGAGMAAGGGIGAVAAAAAVAQARARRLPALVPSQPEAWLTICSSLK